MRVCTTACKQTQFSATPTLPNVAAHTTLPSCQVPKVNSDLRPGETVPASDSDQEQGDYRLDGTLREQEEFMLKEVAAKFGITREARVSPPQLHACMFACCRKTFCEGPSDVRLFVQLQQHSQTCASMC